MRMTRIRSSFDTVTFRKKFNGLRELRLVGIFSLTIFPVTSSHRRCNADPGGHMGQTARTDREIDADFATVTISLPSIERSEERRVGKECVSTCRSRGSPYA